MEINDLREFGRPVFQTRLLPQKIAKNTKTRGYVHCFVFFCDLCSFRAQTGMAGTSGSGQPALPALRHRRSHQPRARAYDDQISGSAKRKGVVEKTLEENFVAVSQLQGSRKSTRLTVSKLTKTQLNNEFLLHRYG
jgi:hypothetical protein